MHLLAFSPFFLAGRVTRLITWKVRIVLRLRQETTMTLNWIAKRLKMGAWTHVSNLIAQQRQKGTQWSQEEFEAYIKAYGQPPLNPGKSTSMNERDFWEIISQAGSAAANTEDVPKWIESHLETRSMGEILDFAAWLTTCLKRSNDERLRRAAGKLFRRTGPLADDSWLYFRCWLVARGKEAFDLALRDPACLHSLH